VVAMMPPAILRTRHNVKTNFRDMAQKPSPGLCATPRAVRGAATTPRFARAASTARPPDVSPLARPVRRATASRDRLVYKEKLARGIFEVSWLSRLQINFPYVQHIVFYNHSPAKEIMPFVVDLSAKVIIVRTFFLSNNVRRAASQTNGV
jgi:hypothetical protein